jgi:hypothetical protein
MSNYNIDIDKFGNVLLHVKIIFDKIEFLSKMKIGYTKKNDFFDKKIIFVVSQSVFMTRYKIYPLLGQ